MASVKFVHVVFKTHLDLGFTDLAQNVVQRYQSQFIPRALDLAQRLAHENGPAQFVWTTGSWLISRYLDEASRADRQRMEHAIAQGWVAWHGLPFTTHTELLTADLLEHGLSIAQRLDERFGKVTTAAKMTDVPGHARALVPFLARHRIRFLHIGVNGCSTAPDVPPLFRWQAYDGSEVVVNYSHGYGGTVQMPGTDVAMTLWMTGDNNGPPTYDSIQTRFQELSAQFPEAKIRASTLNAFAEVAWSHRDQLPVVSEEIGDTWIHGASSDPKKLLQYRELLRRRDRWLQTGQIIRDSREDRALLDALLMIPEHTWGVDSKIYLGDYSHYSNREFRQARTHDDVEATAIPTKYAYLNSHVARDRRAYSTMESSWDEQREYVRQAVKSLPPALVSEVQARWKHLEPEPESFSHGDSFELRASAFVLKHFTVGVGEDGALIHLADAGGHRWADTDHPFGRFRYETFSAQDYQTWLRQYITPTCLGGHGTAEADFGKPGLEDVEMAQYHQVFAPSVSGVKWVQHQDAVVVELDMPPAAIDDYGAPSKVQIRYQAGDADDDLQVTLSWFGKHATRLPEASWFSFIPPVENGQGWQIEKLGEWLSPLSVVSGGNRNVHAIGQSLRYRGPEGRMSIQSLDAPLVAPGAPRVLQFDRTFVPLEGGMHFLLHNNLWGSNFPLWYDENATFRFVVRMQ